MIDRAIFFDLFDTLVRVSERTGAYDYLLTKLCLANKEDLTKLERATIKEEFRSLFLSSPTTSNIVEHLMDSTYFNSRPYFQAIVDGISADVKNSLKAQVEREVDSVVAFDGAKEVLERLSQRFKLVLVSNLASPFKEPFYGLGLADYFEATVFSCDVGACKPEPIIYERALAVCSIKDKSRIIMVGDKDRTDGIGAKMADLHYFRSTGRPAFLKELEQFI